MQKFGIFGEEVLFLNEEENEINNDKNLEKMRYLYTVKCSSHLGIVYSLNKKFFETKFPQEF